MKHLITIVLLVVAFDAFSQDTSHYTSYDHVNIDSISTSVGDSVIVKEKVYSGRYLAASPLTLLNLGGEYPNQKLTVVIRGKDREKFNFKPEEEFKGKTILVVGKVAMYNGKPQITVSDPFRISLYDDK